MAHQELIDFIKSQTSRGVAATDVHNALVQNGWTEADVNDAMSAAGVAPVVSAPTMPASAEMPQQMQQPSPATTQPMQPTMQQPQEPEDIFDMDSGPAANMQLNGQGAPESVQQSGGFAGSLLRAPFDATKQAVNTMRNTVEEQMPGLMNNPSLTADGSRLTAGQSVEPDGTLSDGTNANVQVKDGLGTVGKIAVFGVIALVVAGIVGGAIWGYFYFKQTPERVSQLFVNGVSATNAVAFNGAVIKNDAIEYSFNGSIDTQTPSLDITIESTDPTTGAEYGMTIRALNNNMYGSFHTTASNPNAEELANAWIKLDGTTAATLLGTVLPVAGTINTQLSLPISGTERQDLATAIQTHPFITNLEKQGKSTKDGVNVITYTGTINGTELAAFAKQAEPTLRTSGLSSTLVGRMTAANMPYDGKAVTLVLDAQNYRLYGITVDLGESRRLEINFSQYNSVAAIKEPTTIVTAERMFELLQSEETDDTGGAAGTSEEGTVNEDDPLDTDTDTNAEEDTDVEEDTDAEEDSDTNTEEDSDATDEEDEDEVDTDGDGLSDADEKRYGTDPSENDTDGDSYTDGEEVKNGYNPLGDGKLKS